MSRTRIAVLSVAMAAAFVPTARADANSLFDGLGPRELGVGEAMRAEATGGSAITLNPAGLALNQALVFETGYGHRPDDGADTIAISACDSTVPIPGCFYYRWLSADPEIGGESFSRRAHEAGYVAARQLSRQIILGVTYKYFDYNSELTTAGEGDASGHSTDVGVTLVLAPSIKVASVLYNAAKTTDSAQYPRAAATGLVVRPSKQIMLSADALWNLELEDDQSTGRYGGGAEYFVVASDGQAGYPLRLGVVRDQTVEGTWVTGGLGFRTLKVGLDVGMRKQVTGGDELLVLGSIRLFAPVSR